MKSYHFENTISILSFTHALCWFHFLLWDEGRFSAFIQSKLGNILLLSNITEHLALLCFTYFPQLIWNSNQIFWAEFIDTKVCVRCLKINVTIGVISVFTVFGTFLPYLQSSSYWPWVNVQFMPSCIFLRLFRQMRIHQNVSCTLYVCHHITMSTFLLCVKQKKREDKKKRNL